MIAQLTAISVTINDRPFTLLCSPDSPILDARSAIDEIIKEIDSIEVKAKEMQEAAKATEEQKGE